MRKLAIGIALASTMLATPALARDGSVYAGIEGGLMLVEDTELDYRDDDGIGLAEIGDGVRVNHKTGFDVDGIVGYDFGGVRVEGELAYKRASVDEVELNTALGGAGAVPLDADGRASVISAMANILLDFGDDDGWSGYVGPGIGFAKVKYNVDVDDVGVGFRDSDGAMAWQVVAGIRRALSDNLDLGLKYRFFNVKKFKLSDDEAPGPLGPTSNAVDLTGRFRSHSLLLSLIYNF